MSSAIYLLLVWTSFYAPGPDWASWPGQGASSDCLMI